MDFFFPWPCGNPSSDFAQGLSVLTTASSLVIALLAAWGLARKRGPIPALLDSICTLPLVLPPTVLGYYLILLVGRRGGLIGSALAEAGINLIFSWQGSCRGSHGGGVPTYLQIRPGRSGKRGFAS